MRHLVRHLAHKRRAAATGGLAVIMAVAMSGPALASSPAASPRPAATRCTFAQQGWTQCVRVRARMNKAPAVGKTATVSFDVSAQAPVVGARLQADLPGFLRWANLPKGLTPVRVASAVPGNGGTVNRAAAVVDLSTGETRHFQGSVTAVRSGDAEVQVRL